MQEVQVVVEAQHHRLLLHPQLHHPHQQDRGLRVRTANTFWGWKRRVARFIIRRRQHPQRIATTQSNHSTAMNQD